VGWPAVGYVSLEDVDGYREFLARLVADAPPTVAALASMPWNEARVATWRLEDARRHRGNGHDDDPVHTVHASFVVRNDEVLDTPDGLWRRWNHAEVTIRLDGATLEDATASIPVQDADTFDLLAGDAHVSRVEFAHAGGDEWEFRMLITPTGELAIHFRDAVVEVRSVDEDRWDDLEARPAHGWHGPVPDGWVDHAVPAVRAAAHGDVGGLSLELDGFGSDPTGIDELDPRWGFAPIHAAAWFDRVGVLEALLERGARVDVEDSEGRTALDLAHERGSRRSEEVLMDHFGATGPLGSA
jgi:hypothetical protein